jgi:hypothetical protein
VEGSQDAISPRGVIHLYQFEDDRDMVLASNKLILDEVVQVHKDLWRRNPYSAQDPDETTVCRTLYALTQATV